MANERAPSERRIEINIGFEIPLLTRQPSEHHDDARRPSTRPVEPPSIAPHPSPNPRNPNPGRR